MARKKIIVASSKLTAESRKNNFESISLVVNFKREFTKPFSKDLSHLLDGIDVNKCFLKFEIAKFVFFVNSSSMSGETKKKYVEVFEEFVQAIQPKQLRKMRISPRCEIIAA